MGIDLALVVGHDRRNPGAKGHGPGEHWMWRAEAPAFRRAARGHGLSCMLFHRAEGLELAAQYDDLIRRILAVSPRVVVDLHHNGGGHPGSYALHGGAKGHADSPRLAEAVARAFAVAQATEYKRAYCPAGQDGRPRAWTGKETEAPDGRWYPGGNVLRVLELPMPACVVEPFDGSDWSDYQAGLRGLVSGESPEAFAAAVAAFLGGITA